MRATLYCLLWTVLAAGTAAAASGSTSADRSGKVPSEEQILSSFDADGWQVADSMTTRLGRRGFYAEHKTSTTLGTAAPKKLYYVEGDGHDMGWLHGALSAKTGDAKSMCTTYVHHIILNLLSESFDEEMAAKCDGWIPGSTGTAQAKANDDDGAEDGMSCATYEKLLDFMEVWLVTGTFTSFLADKAKFPVELIAEMEGFVAGSVAEDPSCGCTFEKMVYLNYGIDFIMGNLYAGQLPRILGEAAARAGGQGVTDRMAEEIASMSPSAFRIPFYCDAFGAVNAATLSGEDAYMARDFQLPTGLVYQDSAADMIYFPTDGRLPHVSSGAPGFIGRMTGVNAHGVSMGVDLLRASSITPDTPGLNSCLLLRAVMDRATSTKHGVEIIAEAARGVTWLYPMCDGAANCVTIEAGKYMAEGTPFDPLQFVNSSEVRAALPSAEFYEEHSSSDIYTRGMYTRPMNWAYPEEYLSYNEALYAVANVTYDASEELWGPTGFLFPSFEEENDVTTDALHNNFFPPQRETRDDIIIISNNAIVPEFRTAMMSYGGNFWEVTAHAAQWRYDSLNKMLADNYGSIDAAKAIEILSFLSPAVTPGYWTNTINASDPMSAIVEGTMNVVDIVPRRLHTKTGYWSDDWTFVTLGSFLA